MQRESCISRGQPQTTKGIDLLAFGLAATCLLYCGHFLQFVVGAAGRAIEPCRPSHDASKSGAALRGEWWELRAEYC